MTRSHAVAAAILLLAPAPVLAQAHPQPHTPPPGPARPHGPDHVRPHGAAAAALHALWHGSWVGTLTPAQGGVGPLYLSVAPDRHGQGTVGMRTDLSVAAGRVSDLVVRGDTLQWTQELSGRRCDVIAVVHGAAPQQRETITGRTACADGPATFVLRKAQPAE